MSDELDSFVKDSLSQGLERSAIRDVLLQAGWADVINEYKRGVPPAPVRP